MAALFCVEMLYTRKLYIVDTNEENSFPETESKLFILDGLELSNILLKKIPSGIVKMILPKRSEKYDRKNCYYENQLRIKRRYLLAL